MKLILALLFAAFAVSAALTFLLQIKYGRLTGSEREAPDHGTTSPAAKKCRRQAIFCAVFAGIFLIAACAVGASIRS